ncbi:unnamed protein product [Calicophoron daubneyi]|uniref:Saposin B-type domain-containing protein n=1 Tax=Calicophoron daubneyi TaxID=300641 RepID=A0AAV2T6Q5_CALDB
MRLLVLFALIGLSVAVPDHQDPANSRLCDICVAGLGELIKLFKRGAAEHMIFIYIKKTCDIPTVVGDACKLLLTRAYKYLKQHPDESDATKVCTAIHACR